jgi:outer membrane protein TolC
MRPRFHFGPRLAGCAFAALAMLAQARIARAETLTLADCLRETAEHNPVIIQQRLAVEAASGTRLVFRSRALPSLLLSGLGGQQGEQTAEDIETTAIVDGKRETVHTLYPRKSTLFLIGEEALYQPIFDAAIPAAFRRGNVEVAAARSNLLVTASAELYQARTEFYTVLFRQQYGALLEEIGKGLAANVQGQTELLQAGLGNRQAVLAAQVQQVNLQPQILDSTGALRATLTALLQTMGRPLGAGAAPAGSITLAGPWDDGGLNFDAAAVAKESRDRRPDLLALRNLVRAYAEDANIARGGYYPLIRIYVTGELLPEDFVQGQRANAVRPEDNTQESEISPGIREDWSVIDTGTVRGAVGQLEKTRDAVAISVHHLEADIPSELDLVRAEFASGARERELYETNVGISADTMNMIQSGVAQGTDSQLDFLQAQTSVVATRAGLLAAKLRMSLAHAEYDRVTGGYVRFITEGKPAATAATK